MTDLYKHFKEKYPFISFISYGNQEYIGIVLNKDQTIVSMYDYTALPTLEHKKQFLELGEIWWWESNRKYPISIFLRNEFQIFKPYIKNFIAKDVTFIHGPYVSINELSERRTKRKNIQLVYKVKK